jgi:hypothetical protein
MNVIDQNLQKTIIKSNIRSKDYSFFLCIWVPVTGTERYIQQTNNSIKFKEDKVMSRRYWNTSYERQNAAQLMNFTQALMEHDNGSSSSSSLRCFDAC